MVNSSERLAARTGGCLCGAVRFAIRGALREITICHCAMCRRSSTSVGAYTACAPADLSVTGSKLRWYRSSPIARRGFCGKCGSQLFWEPSDGDHISISVGSLDDASTLSIAEHIFVAHDPTALRAFALPRSG